MPNERLQISSLEYRGGVVASSVLLIVDPDLPVAAHHTPCGLADSRATDLRLDLPGAALPGFLETRTVLPQDASSANSDMLDFVFDSDALVGTALARYMRDALLAAVRKKERRIIELLGLPRTSHLARYGDSAAIASVACFSLGLGPDSRRITASRIRLTVKDSSLVRGASLRSLAELHRRLAVLVAEASRSAAASVRADADNLLWAAKKTVSSLQEEAAELYSALAGQGVSLTLEQVLNSLATIRNCSSWLAFVSWQVGVDQLEPVRPRLQLVK